MKYINFSITALSLLAFTSCSNISDLWLGDEKKEKLAGERVSIYSSRISNNVDEEYNKTTISIPEPTILTALENSSGINSVIYPNLKLETDYKASKEFSFMSARIFPNITPPLFLEDKIVILDTSGKLLAYNSNTGKKLWEATSIRKSYSSGFLHISPDFYYGGMAYNEDTLYITQGTNTIYAISMSDGSIIWSKEIASPTRATPLLVGDYLVIQTLDNSTYALNRTNGEIVWSHFGVKSEVSTVETSSPLFVNNIILVQYSNGEVVGLEVNTGNELLTLNNYSGLERLNTNRYVHSVVHKVILDESILIFYDNEGVVSAFDLKDGVQLWSKSLGFNKPLWSCGELIIGVNDTKQLLVLNKYNGKVKWQTNLKEFEDKKSKQDTFWSEPIVAEGKVLVVNSQGKLLEFNINTGENILQKQVIKGVYLSPIIVNEKLYLISSEGKIIEYN